jgi:molybdopterin converting factor small subunit
MPRDEVVQPGEIELDQGSGRLVRLYAGAREAAGTSELFVTAETVGELSAVLVDRYGARMGQIFGVSSLLSDGESLTIGHAPDTKLPGHGPVDVLPPFAGG